MSHHPLRWVELTPDYRCNNRCTGCFAVRDDGPSMSDREALDALLKGRTDGADGLWIGGGEPTLRRDLFKLAAAAKKLGYARVKLQTNGMMLAYPEYARRCAEAGVTEVAFSIKGASAATHDRIAHAPGCYDLMVRGVENARGLGLGLEADLMVTRSNAHEIPAMVTQNVARGVGRFRVWMLSAVDAAQGDPAVVAEVPTMREVAPRVVEALAHVDPDDPEALLSLHTPPCVLPDEGQRARFFAPSLGLRVVNPGGHAFRLEESPIEGGHFLPGCAGCRYRPRCNGPRRDYVALHGPDEFVPVP